MADIFEMNGGKRTSLRGLFNNPLFLLPWPSLSLHRELVLGSSRYFHRFHYQFHYQISSSSKGPQRFSWKFAKLNIVIYPSKLFSPHPPSPPAWFPGPSMVKSEEVPILHALSLKLYQQSPLSCNTCSISYIRKDGPLQCRKYICPVMTLSNLPPYKQPNVIVH